jgi:hypothetical protein
MRIVILDRLPNHFELLGASWLLFQFRHSMRLDLATKIGAFGRQWTRAPGNLDVQ